MLCLTWQEKKKKNHTEKVKIVKYLLVPQKIKKNDAFALIKEKDYPTSFFLSHYHYEGAS